MTKGLRTMGAHLGLIYQIGVDTMIGSDPKLIIENSLRPCFVDGKRALFHRWEDKAEVVGESPLRGGHPGGQIWATLGIVEFEDGTVQEVYPVRIRFVTHKDFEECAWGTTQDS